MRLFSDVATTVADPYLREAFRLAERGLGTTAPNPVVGCVVVRDGQIVGKGYHAYAGGPHAEIAALGEAGPAARDADVFVTLEPCAHTGRTPPCADALIAAGVGSVTIGMPDPTPVAGGGATRLRDAGITVSFAEDPAPFEALNEGWLHRLATGLPFVQVKVALTLDGRPALVPGRRSRISGEGGSAITQRLRRVADAVAVGLSTAIIDEPALTRRDDNGQPLASQPLRVVIGRDRAPDPLPALLFDQLGPAVLLLSSAADIATPLASGAPVVTYPPERGVPGALTTLAERGVTRLLVEPGPTLFAALWDTSAIDELVIVHAGGLGGTCAPDLYHSDTSVPHPLDQLAVEMYAAEAGVAGQDGVTVWRPVAPAREREGVSLKEGA